MLILTRRLEEIILVGDNVQVIAIDIDGNQVRLGIKAPKEMPIHREEIYKRIKNESVKSRTNKSSESSIT
jgi:carbon storage regulator